MDKELQKLLQQWHVEAPDNNLAERVIAHATALPQKRPLSRCLNDWLNDFFGNWQAGMAYKCASLALCALIGFSAGWQPQEAMQVDVTALAFGVQVEGGGL